MFLIYTVVNSNNKITLINLNVWSKLEVVTNNQCSLKQQQHTYIQSSNQTTHQGFVNLVRPNNDLFLEERAALLSIMIRVIQRGYKKLAYKLTKNNPNFYLFFKSLKPTMNPKRKQ